MPINFGTASDRASQQHNRGDEFYEIDTGRRFLDVGNSVWLELSQYLPVERLFTEAGAAGVYTATVTVPAGYSVESIKVANTVAWGAGTSAHMDIGDADDAAGYFSAIDLKTSPPTLGTTGWAGGKYYPTGGTITIKVTTVGTTSSAGRSRVLVSMTRGDVGVTAASYVAS